MATFTSNNYEGRYLQLVISETINPKDNTSTLNWTLSSIGGSVNYYSIAPTTATINGTTVYSKGATSWSTQVFPAAKGSTSGSITVAHNADGTKSISVGFSTRVYYSAASEYGGTMTLTKIDRAAPTVSVSTSGITASSITVKATASTTCDRWDYSTNNGSSWVNFSTGSGTSASKTITGLAANTSYNIKVRARKSYNHVYGTSGTTTVKTLGGSVLSSVNTFTADNATAKITLSATVHNTSYTHTLVIKNGSSTVLTLSGLSLSSGSNTITLTSSQRSTVLSAMANIKSFKGTFELKTFSGSSQVGNSSSKTATVQTTSENSAPTFTGFTYADANSSSTAVTGNNQVLIQSVSTLKITASAATAKNGASISSYSAVAGDAAKASTTTEIVVGKINTSGTVPIIVTAIDSRGYTSTATVNITVLEYEKIEISSYLMRRINEVEEYTEVAISGDVTPIMIGGTNKNGLRSMSYRYKKTSDSSYSSYYSLTSQVTKTDNSFSFESAEWLSLDADYSYYVEFLVNDAMTSDNVIITIPQGTPLMSLRRKKVGINNRNPQAGLDVAGGAKIDDLNGMIKAVNGILGSAVAGTDYATPPADYIVQRGTSGIWTYRKWNSGDAECWGTVTCNNVTANNEWGAFYESNLYGPVNYPFTFTERPKQIMSVSKTTTHAFFIETPFGSSYSSTNTNTGSWAFSRPKATAGTNTVYVDIYVKGKWK